MGVFVFVVGNVSAKTEVKLGEDEATFKAVKDINTESATYKNQAGYTSDVKTSGKVSNKNTTITIDEVTLHFIDELDWTNKKAAWVGFRTEVPELKDGNTGYNLKGTYAINGGEEKIFFDDKVDNFTNNDDGDFIMSITPEKLQEAVKNGGNLTFTYVIKWTFSKEETDKNTEGTFEQTVTIKMNAMKVTLMDDTEDSEDNDVAQKILWAPSIAKAYKATLVSATPTEENKTTEENKKDDVPKTGEVIYNGNYWLSLIKQKLYKDV